MALVVFDIANFSDTVRTGEIAQARRGLLRLANIVGGWPCLSEPCAIRGRRDYVILAATNTEESCQLMKEVPWRLAEGRKTCEPTSWWLEHGGHTDELVAAASKAWKTVKRLDGGGIVVAP